MSSDIESYIQSVESRRLMLWLFVGPTGFLLLRYSVLFTVESFLICMF